MTGVFVRERSGTLRLRHTGRGEAEAVGTRPQAQGHLEPPEEKLGEGGSTQPWDLGRERLWDTLISDLWSQNCGKIVSKWLYYPILTIQEC